jgi:hypothetical protein
MWDKQEQAVQKCLGYAGFATKLGVHNVLEERKAKRRMEAEQVKRLLLMLLAAVVVNFMVLLSAAPTPAA